MRELAATGAPVRVPVAVTCRVLKLHRQHYYAWLGCPVTDSELEEAYLANAIFDAHREDPEFGYRLLFDEVTDAGHQVSERAVWKICSANEWWCVFGKKRRGKKGLPGTPAHDDLVRRDFTARSQEGSEWARFDSQRPATPLRRPQSPTTASPQVRGRFRLLRAADRKVPRSRSVPSVSSR